jgi:RNA polymerase sigma-70 factor, ECF subfamily
LTRKEALSPRETLLGQSKRPAGEAKAELSGYESTEVSDELLMVRYQRGDRDAFATLVRRHKLRIYNFVLQKLRDSAAAEDVAQEVFLRVVQKAADFKHEARFSTWLYTIARNLCIDHLRKQSLRKHPSLDDTLGPTAGERTLGETLEDRHHSSSVERTAVSKEFRVSVSRAIDALPADQKEVFLLREIGNLAFKDIAEVSGVGENTVKSRMRYALERLQQALSEFEEYARELK